MNEHAYISGFGEAGKRILALEILKLPFSLNPQTKDAKDMVAESCRVLTDALKEEIK